MVVKHNISFVSHEDGNGHIELWKEEVMRKAANAGVTEIINTEYEKQYEDEKEIKAKIPVEHTSEVEDASKEKETITYIVRKTQLFKFELKRQKSKISKLEHIEIEAYHMGQSYGKITADMMTLRDTFTEFKRYGVVLSRSLYSEISNCIENNYLQLKANETDFAETKLTEAVIDDIFGMFCAYIKEYSFHSTKSDAGEIYPIPVEMFDNYLEESDYANYGKTAVRKALKGKYTHTNVGRNDYLSQPCGEIQKKFKSIAFWKKLVDERNKKPELP